MSTHAHFVPRRPPARRLPPRLTPLRRARRVLTIALALCSVPIVISYLSMLAGPSNSSLTIRTFEWLRDNGAAKIAVQIEDFYYSWAAPSTGGPALRKLPLTQRVAPVAQHPLDVAPVISPALPGEGVWVPSESWSGADPPVQVTQFRSDPLYPEMVAGVAWIATQRVRLVLYPGMLEPAVSMPRGPAEVPADRRSRLLATFNSGFKLADSHGGVVVGGTTYAPLWQGMATLIGYADGRVDIEAWKWGSTAPAGVRFARQNLPLIVDGGRPNSNLSDGPAWGVTVGNAIRVWRSGIGVDAHGDLIYAAADNQTVSSLAAILIRAGAVRGMQLDINSYWDTFNSYGQPGAGQPAKLLPSMTRPATRYLTPDDRDFFAVFLR
jgi:Phosphodiester glycosidase